MSNAIQLASTAHVETFRFTQDQRKLILDTCCGGASQQEANALIAIAEMRGLNPITGECYFVKRWDSQKGRSVWAVQISIDSMRIKAEESGLYAGQDEPEYEYDPGSKTPKLARVKVYRRDWERPCVGVARFDEYVQRTKEGAPTKFWAGMPHNQLAKCAEALALRKAFPARLAKLYTAEEMAQAGNDAPEAIDAPTRPASSPPPALHEGGAASAEWSAMSVQVSQASSTAELKELAKRSRELVKKGRLTLTQAAELADLAKARKAALEAPPAYDNAAGEALGGEEMPAGWGGEDASNPKEPCFYCRKPVGPGAVQFESTDGELVQKHAGCTAFGAGPVEREPGSDDR